MDEIGKLAEALRSLGAAAETAMPKGNKLSDFGYNCPPLTAVQLKSYAVDVAEEIDNIDRKLINEKYKTTELVAQIEVIKTQTVPYFANGNPTTAWPAYFATIEWIRSSFAHFFERNVNWKSVADSNKLPRSFAARLRTLDTALDKYKERADDFQVQIKTIEDAYNTALNLPADTAEMRAIKADIEKLKSDAEADRAQAALSAQKAAEILSEIRSIEDESAKLLENTHGALRAATTKGLGEAFQSRADDLSKSMTTWVLWLVMALLVGALIGGYRVYVLQTLLTEQAPARAIWVNLVFSILSLAAPVWFAWIATKQIGHRFRLSEDYAFKASVAKAYEGYRREAARLDDDFVKRLFGSILDRLEEPPIRFVENETPGTPWQEFFSSRMSVPGLTPRRNAPSSAQSPQSESSDPTSTE